MAEAVNASQRRATGRTLLIVSALGVAGFAGWSLAQLQLASSQAFLAEAWHALGLIVFAGLFALVAWRPRAYPGLMELTIAHSIGMFLLALTNQDAAGATATMILHGLLAIALLIAYVVLGSIKAWGHQTPAETTPAATKDPAGAGDRRTDSKGSKAKPRGNRQPSSESASRPIAKSPEAPAQPGSPSSSSPDARPTQPGTQPTRPMPQELPEDRPRG